MLIIISYLMIYCPNLLDLFVINWYPRFYSEAVYWGGAELK